MSLWPGRDSACWTYVSVSSSVKVKSQHPQEPLYPLNSAVVSCSLQGEINTESQLGQAVGSPVVSTGSPLHLSHSFLTSIPSGTGGKNWGLGNGAHSPTQVNNLDSCLSHS